MRTLNLVGQRFGRLTVMSRCPRRPRDKESRWHCKCDCGNDRDVLAGNLRSGQHISCGCLRKERNLLHGQAGRRTPTYMSWAGMFARCYNPKTQQYKNYGGRGIKVHPSFRDFQTFLEHIGERPPGTSLDRIDVNGDYAPGNVRWATDKQQTRNKRDNRLITYKGETMCVTDWGEKLGINRKWIDYRLNAGWPIEKVLQPGRATRKSRIGKT
jgi:hypothetical protein